jgi:NAD dependent epimerase/dehydratase family enzyme
VKYFVGAPLGSGEQLINWIHIDDLCRLFIKAVDDSSMSGAYNAVGPYAVTNRELTKAIAKALHKPLILPFVPAFVLNLMLGELAEVVLKGSNVSSGKIVKEGFSFQFNTLENALEDLLRDPKKN